jgi:hypothetical protein
MDSSAPSSTTTNLTASTRFDGSSSAIAIDSASPFNIDPLTINFDTNDKIDIDSAINTAVGIAVLAIIDTNPSKTEVDIAGSTIIDTASPSAADLTPATIIIDPTSGMAGAVSVVTGGFDMAFGLFNFHVDNDGVVELISVSDSTPPAVAPSASPVIKGNPSTTILLAPSEEEPRLKTSTLSVGLNDFKDPPLSPTTAYCVDCDAYHYVGARDFSSHEIAGCEDPRGGTAAIYPMISECEHAFNALTLHPTPYDPDYVEGLYSDYTCSDDNDDVYPEAKGKFGNSISSYSSESATSSSGYMVDYNSDIMIEVGSHIKDDDIYPPTLGEISDDSIPPFGGHCMMASHGDRNEHRSNDGRDRSNTGRQFITQDQIRHARRVYSGKANMGPHPSLQEIAALRFVVQEQKDQISALGASWSNAEKRPTRPAEDGPKDHLITHQASSAGRSRTSSPGPMCTTSPEI